MIFNNVGQFCRYFRSEVLNLTLQEMSDKVNVKTSTLSSFENGRSTNLSHVIKYFECGDYDQKSLLLFILTLYQITTLTKYSIALTLKNNK